jgi:hypothetical protein
MKTLLHRGAGLLTTSLLLAGVSTLSPASVRAAGNDSCSFNGDTSKPNCSGYIFSKQGDKMLNLISLPSVGAGTITFSEATPGVWVVDVDFFTELMAPAMGTFEYQLEINADNAEYFNRVGLDIIGPSVGAIVEPMFKGSKTVNGVLPPTGVNPRVLSVDQDDRSDIDSFAGLLKKINVKDTYMVSSGSINSIQNSYSQKTFFPPEEEVPGPLPLLGAGAAFAFSRRLRTRVLAARGA